MVRESPQDRIGAALERYLGAQGGLACAAAFRMAEDLRVAPLQVGQEADRRGVRLNRCQLGLFGYGDKAKGRHRILEPAETVPPELAQALRDELRDGRLPCKAVWEVGARYGVARLEVAAAAEALGIKMGPCQLGAF